MLWEDLAKKEEGTMNANSSSEETDKALVDAAFKGDARNVAKLLSKGARMDARDRGFTPLLVAAQCGHTEVCQLLLKTSIANVTEKTSDDFTSLLAADQEGHNEVFALLVDKGKANHEETEPLGNTALKGAESEGYEGTAALLLDKGKANLEETELLGNTALMVAAIGGHVGIVAMLVLKGAKVDATNKQGFTPLLAAA